MINEALPCPFCGSAHVKLVLEFSSWYVDCLECGANGPMITDGEDGDTSRAIDGWNRVASLRSDLEENWRIVHDEHCTNMRDCLSFGGTKDCFHPRPDSLQP